MKTHAQMKGRAPAKVTSQQVIFQLKHKVVLALNKLADRDTYQIGVNELEKTAECLTPDMFAPFLSCVLDTDSEQKSAVRKECIRVIATLAKFHAGLVRPNLVKIVASIIKRLKDPDSVVRDACVETVGFLAAKLGDHGVDSDEVFVELVRPIFEALGEQNRQVQIGSALCLASVIDNIRNPPVSILQRMLTRTTKMLKNPHFIAKPAVIDLNRSIIQAGGSPNKNVLSAAMVGFQESLKNSDWTTRKAAAAALGEIASSCGSFLGSFRLSCIHCLESCRFDKVKPVRDTVLQALQYWRNVQGPDTPEPSEAGSSIKGSFSGGDFDGLTGACETGRKDIRKTGVVCAKARIPVNARKRCQDYAENTENLKSENWHIEIAVPKCRNLSAADFQSEESEGNSSVKTRERVSTEVTSMQDSGFEYLPVDDKQECSSVSNLVHGSFDTKFITDSNEHLEEDSFLESISGDRQLVTEETTAKQLYSANVRDRRSIESTITDSGCQITQGCCSQLANEMVCIRKQLLEIENKQCDLVDLIKVLNRGVMDNLANIQSRVLDLEHVVDRLTQDIRHGCKSSDLSNTKFMRQNQCLSSPRLSTCTSRASVSTCHRESSLLSRSSSVWDESDVGFSHASNNAGRVTDSWGHSKFSGKSTGKHLHKFHGQGTQNKGIGHLQKCDSTFSASSFANARKNATGVRKCVKSLLCQGDMESAYAEALTSKDELLLLELLDGTGPVLESLSPKTACDILKVVASFLREQRFINSLVPWLQQVVELSNIQGPTYFVLSAKARQEFISAMEDAANNDFSNAAERRSIAQLAMGLQHIWGK